MISDDAACYSWFEMRVIRPDELDPIAWTEAVTTSFEGLQALGVTEQQKNAIREQTKLLFRVSHEDPEFELRLQKKGSVIVAKERVKGHYKTALMSVNSRLAAYAAVKYMKSIGLRKRDNPDLFEHLLGEGRIRMYKDLIDGFNPTLGYQFSTYVIESLQKYFRGLTKNYFNEKAISLDDGDLDDDPLQNSLSDTKAVRPDDAAVTNEAVAGLTRALTLLEPVVIGRGQSEIIFNSAQLLRLKYGIPPFEGKGLADLSAIGVEQFCTNSNQRGLTDAVLDQAVRQALNQLNSKLREHH